MSDTIPLSPSLRLPEMLKNMHRNVCIGITVWRIIGEGFFIHRIHRSHQIYWWPK